MVVRLAAPLLQSNRAPLRIRAARLNGSGCGRRVVAADALLQVRGVASHVGGGERQAWRELPLQGEVPLLSVLRFEVRQARRYARRIAGDGGVAERAGLAGVGVGRGDRLPLEEIGQSARRYRW